MKPSPSAGIRKVLDNCHVVQSFPKKGHPYDNAVAECFFKYLMFERYKNGEKAKSIVNRLNETGIHNKSSARFTVNSFAKIIRNSKYMGAVISNGQTYNNIVPVLVDEQTFKACNDIMDNQRHKQKVVQDHSPYILSGKLFCGNCGTLMTAEDGTSHTGRVYHYYKCFNRKLHREQCNKSNITKEKLEDLVFGKTVEYVLQPSIIDKFAVAVTEKFNEGLQKSDTLALLEKEQKQVQKAIDGFLSAIAAGIVPSLRKRSYSIWNGKATNWRVKLR